jgi:phenylpropionate dioxygenase-like ring-hydroxylating dioxygenase large terminal subunit
MPVPRLDVRPRRPPAGRAAHERRRRFDKAEFPLHAAALGTWEGFLFVNLRPQPPALEAALAPLAGKFAAWRPAELRAVRRIEYDVRANWKLFFQNFSERVYYYSVFPNLFLTLLPDYVMWHTLWPLAVDRTRIVCEWLFAPELGAQAADGPEDAVAFWDRTNRQDWHVCELAQAGVSSRAYTPGPYAVQESLLAAFDREYLASGVRSVV